jgi:hypothetical protein
MAGQMLSLAGRHLRGIAQLPPEYFDTERFTVEEAMDRFWGVEALTQLAERNHPSRHQMLMLLSGHKIEGTPNLRSSRRAKPLKQWNSLPLLEAHVFL